MKNPFFSSSWLPAGPSLARTFRFVVVFSVCWVIHVGFLLGGFERSFPFSFSSTLFGLGIWGEVFLMPLLG